MNFPLFEFCQIAGSKEFEVLPRFMHVESRQGHLVSGAAIPSIEIFGPQNEIMHAWDCEQFRELPIIPTVRISKLFLGLPSFLWQALGDR